jgi:two-component system OmpR family response regulator
MKMENKISVFLVDDNDMFLQTLAASLTEQFKSEIQVESFPTGEACLNKIQQNPVSAVDIVILDYHLNTDSKGAMDGVDILKKIKKLNSKIVVVMLSSEDKIKIATECIANGAYEYVVKSETAFIRTQNILKNSMEKEFNSRILKVTMTILEKYPELSKYIEEMQETIPNEVGPEITLRNLKSYLDSLNSMMDRYKVEHPPLTSLSI